MDFIAQLIAGLLAFGLFIALKIVARLSSEIHVDINEFLWRRLRYSRTCVANSTAYPSLTYVPSSVRYGFYPIGTTVSAILVGSVGMLLFPRFFPVAAAIAPWAFLILILVAISAAVRQQSILSNANEHIRETKEHSAMLEDLIQNEKISEWRWFYRYWKAAHLTRGALLDLYVREQRSMSEKTKTVVLRRKPFFTEREFSETTILVNNLLDELKDLQGFQEVKACFRRDCRGLSGQLRRLNRYLRRIQRYADAGKHHLAFREESDKNNAQQKQQMTLPPVNDATPVDEPDAEPEELRFECYNCGQHLAATVDRAGQLIACPTCQAQTTIPSR